MSGLIAFWSHGLAAALYAALVLWELRRGIRIGGGQRMLLAALALTACWAWLTAVEPTSMLAAYAETARNLVWVGVLYSLGRHGDSGERQHGVQLVYAAVAGVLGLQLVVDALPLFIDTGDQRRPCADRRPRSSCASPPRPARWCWSTTSTARPRPPAAAASASRCSRWR